MTKLLIGGSPCTFWSIAQKNNRETEPKGLGWELFLNYLIAKEKFKPDFFLYENNCSAAQPIKDEIKKRLDVWDGTFLQEDSGARYIEINSALVSAQRRKRFYVHNCGEVEQPEDRGILLRDILESGIAFRDEKSYCLDTCYYKGGNETDFNNQSGKRLQVAEPVIFQTPRGKNNGGIKYEKSPTMTANAAWEENNKCLVPIRLGDIGSHAQGYRVYSSYGKSVSIISEGGGQGGKTGLYFVPIENVGESKIIEDAFSKLAEKYGFIPEMFNAYNLTKIDEKSPTLSTGSMVTSSCAVNKIEGICEKCIFYQTKNCDTCELKNKNVYEVRNGLICIHDKL